ncbi:zinc finger BED domain-containing protein DAYSLEEPER [Prunus yedoensis var. nudiflora]|uniref:Zinc finger BED domain-containing protein DAYSLEEPER n=1 Tax=Prunus yedoensis var. nudiflora TaxID=2094558 RepID=A0A314ZNW8_PRUYE|nr:zinc finger BED domain-containing protein DAYSLEEPER [Prunus yedoensis var. nudiflora]
MGYPVQKPRQTGAGERSLLFGSTSQLKLLGLEVLRLSVSRCKRSFAYITGSKLAGTSHLKRHIALGICPVSRQKNQMTPFTPGSKTGATDAPKRRSRANTGYARVSFDQDRCNHDIAKMIIMHGYPLHIAEQLGFINFVQTLQPQFNLGLLSVKNPHMLNSQLLLRNCYARVLSSLACDVLVAMRETIAKVRESVKFVKTSESHEEKFVQLKQQLQVPSTKNLSVMT